MSSSSYERARSNNDPHFNVLDGLHTSYPLKKLGNFVMPAVQCVAPDRMALHMNLLEQAMEIAPSPSPPTSAFRTPGARTDFDIDAQEVIPSSVHLRWTVSNSDGSNTITLVPAELQIAKIEVLANGNVKMWEVFGTQLFARANMYNNSDQRSARSVYSNTNQSTYAGATAIGTSSSVTYEIEVPGLWNIMDMSLAWAESWRIRVFWNGSNSKSAGTPAITVVDLADAKIIIAEKMLPAAEASIVHNLPKNAPNGLLVQYVDALDQQFNPTYGNSQTSQHTLDSFNGRVVEWLCVARTALVGAPLAAASDVFESFELRDANNRQLKSHQTNARHLRESVIPMHYPSNFNRICNYNVVSPIPGGLMAFEAAHGANIGSETFSANRFNFTTTSGAAGTYYVDFYGYQMILINFAPSRRVTMKPSA